MLKCCQFVRGPPVYFEVLNTQSTSDIGWARDLAPSLSLEINEFFYWINLIKDFVFLITKSKLWD